MMERQIEKPIPTPAGIVATKALDNPLAILRSDAKPRAAYRDEQALRRAQFRPDNSSRALSLVLVLRGRRGVP